MKLADRVKRIKPSPTVALNQKAKELAAAGKSVVNLTVGEPDGGTPERIGKAAISAIEKGRTKYTAAAGIPELKDAILKKTGAVYGHEYRRGEVIVTVGAKQALFNLCQVLLEEGDEAVILAPYWVSYVDMVSYTGATPMIVATRESDGFLPDLRDLAKAVTPRTRILFLCSPCNPTGAVIPRETLSGIAALQAKFPMMTLVTDDIYGEIVFDHQPFVSVAMLPEVDRSRMVIVNGVSKSYAMTGWRIGYALGPEAIIRALETLQSQSTSNASSISQWAAIEAISGNQTDVYEMRQIFQNRRDRMLTRLREIPNLTCVMPAGAFYFFPNVSAYLGRSTPEGKSVATDLDLAEYLLEKEGVAVVPGSDFGAPGHIRISFSASLEELDEGVRRLARGLAALSA